MHTNLQGYLHVVKDKVISPVQVDYDNHKIFQHQMLNTETFL